MIDQCEDSDVIQYRDLLKRLCILKHKDVLKESLQEYSRRGNFVRIYPSKGSDCYDPYFVQTRPLNHFLYRMLYTNELLQEVSNQNAMFETTTSQGNPGSKG